MTSELRPTAGTARRVVRVTRGKLCFPGSGSGRKKLATSKHMDDAIGGEVLRRREGIRPLISVDSSAAQRKGIQNTMV